MPGSTDHANPYIQMQPTTNRSEAHLDFVNTRLNGVDTTGSQAALLNVTYEPQTSTNDSDSDDSDVTKVVNDVKNLANKSVWYIVGFVVGGVVLLALIIGLIVCCCRRKRYSARSGPGRNPTNAPFMPGMQAYRQLQDPLPARPESPVWDSHAGDHPPAYKYPEPDYRYTGV